MREKKKGSFFSRSLLVSSMVALSACSTFSELDENTTTQARLASTPNAEARRTLTNFSGALRCMDDLFVRYHVPDTSLAIQQVDEVGENRTGIKDMFLTAVSSMSAASQTIQVSLYGQDLPDLTYHNQVIHDTSSISPIEYFVRIGTPLIDEGAIVAQRSVGLQYNGSDFTIGDTSANSEGASDVKVETFGVSNSMDRMLSIISLDMHVGSAVNARLLPGVFSSNSISISRAGKATDVSASFESFGALFDLSFDRSEGLHHSIRTLVELGAIETIGKLTRVPYWECLDIPSTRSEVQLVMYEWYKKLSQSERIIFIQRSLTNLGYYKESITGFVDDNTTHAVMQYKRQAGLIVNSSVNYALYASLMATSGQSDLALRLDENQAISNAISFEQDSGLNEAFIPPQRLNLSMELNVGNNSSSTGSVKLDVNVSENAYLACYLKLVNGKVFQVLPKSNSGGHYIKKSTPRNILNDIGFNMGKGKQQMMCVASYDNLYSKIRDEHIGISLTDAMSSGDLIQVYALYKTLAIKKNMVLPLVEFIDINVE